MNIPETFYIALCVTILMLGIVYWFWTQVQYLQRKVNLLDNIVYEMKTLISNLPGSTSERPMENLVPTVYSAPPESVAGDLEAERLASEIEFDTFSGSNDLSEKPVSNIETVYSAPPEDESSNRINEINDDLQPGGLAGGDNSNVKNIATFTDSSIESPLSSMSIKELRRMAEANNIPGAAELRKKDLIKLLRDKVGQIIGGNQEQGQEQEQEQGLEQAKVLSFDDIGAPNSE
jgi:hypothetical protein